MTDDNVTHLDDFRNKTAKVAIIKMPPQPAPRKGPFTVRVSDTYGAMFEVTFPDHTGELPMDSPILATPGESNLLVNLLTSALRIFVRYRC